MMQTGSIFGEMQPIIIVAATPRPLIAHRHWLTQLDAMQAKSLSIDVQGAAKK